MRTDLIGFPLMPEYVPVSSDNKYDFTKLTLIQLKECWQVCEAQKHYCHPNSVFQPLIDSDMRKMIPLLKSRNRG